MIVLSRILIIIWANTAALRSAQVLNGLFG